MGGMLKDNSNIKVFQYMENVHWSNCRRTKNKSLDKKEDPQFHLK